MEKLADPALAPEAPRHINSKAVSAILHPRNESNIVDCRSRAVALAGGKSDFIFARQLERNRVGQKPLRRRNSIRSHIVDFARAHAGLGAGRDISHGIPPTAFARQTNLSHRTQCPKNRCQLHAMDLKFLAGRHVKDPVSPRLSHNAQPPQLLRQYPASRTTNPQHIRPGFALLINPGRNADRPKF